MLTEAEEFAVQFTRIAILRVLGDTSKVLSKDDSISAIFPKLKAIEGTDKGKTLKPLITMAKEIEKAGLSIKSRTYDKFITSFTISCSEFSDFSGIERMIEQDPDLKKVCTVDYYLIQSIPFDGYIPLEITDNLMSVFGKLLSLDSDEKMQAYYKAVLPYGVPDVELIPSVPYSDVHLLYEEISKSRLKLSIHSKSYMLIGYYEEAVTEGYEKFCETFNVD